MSLPGRIRRAARHAALPARALWGRLRQFGPRPPRFAGAFPDRATALASLPARQRSGYDDPDIADISFEAMCEVAPWDYPVLFWLQRLLRPGASLLDAGGHMGTKYIAFSRLLALDAITWTVTDLPGIMTAARRAQDAGAIPAALRFADDPAALPAPDLLLASGLLQYLDQPFADYVARLGPPPPVILLNKVATRPGPTRVTLERIGPARVPYTIRNRAGFEDEIAAMGYRIADTWVIPDLGHRIATHPGLGRSESRGYCLTRVDHNI